MGFLLVTALDPSASLEQRQGALAALLRIVAGGDPLPVVSIARLARDSDEREALRAMACNILSQARAPGHRALAQLLLDGWQQQNPRSSLEHIARQLPKETSDLAQNILDHEPHVQDVAQREREVLATWIELNAERDAILAGPVECKTLRP